YAPLDGTITIDESLYDLCARLGPDSTDALAYVISHELGHYYLHHGVTGYTTKKPTIPVPPRLTRSDTVSWETEADLYGGFFSRMAGYNALDVAPLVLEKIYGEYNVPDDWRYLPRDERKGLAMHTDEHFTALYASYQAANYLT